MSAIARRIAARRSVGKRRAAQELDGDHEGLVVDAVAASTFDRGVAEALVEELGVARKGEQLPVAVLPHADVRSRCASDPRTAAA